MTSRTKALAHFKKVDPRFHAATKHLHSSLPEALGAKKTRAQLFSALVSIVVSQQLGVAAADTIFKRVKEACGGAITPAAVLKVHTGTLARAGLSAAKIKTIKTLAKEVKDGGLDLSALRDVPETEAAERLTQLWGLGPWSVEMFLMFSLGRADIFSAGDLGLARAIEAIYGLPKNAPRPSLLAIAEKWSPYRTFACMLLWRSRDAAPQVLSKGRHR